MKIKTYLATLMLALSSITFSTPAIAASHMTREQQQIRMVEIKQRVKEIKAMDLSQLSTDQRKELKIELKDMRKEIKQMDPTYIYISGGALLLIILILILLV